MSKRDKSVKRHKQAIGRRVLVINSDSPLYGRQGTIKGFRGDHSRGNPYVQVFIDGLHIETLSARNLMYFD